MCGSFPIRRPTWSKTLGRGWHAPTGMNVQPRLVYHRVYFREKQTIFVPVRVTLADLAFNSERAHVNSMTV